MGIIITESEAMGEEGNSILANYGMVLSEHYIGLRKDYNGKVNIHVDFDTTQSNVYKLTSYFEHHISKDAKTQGKTSINSQLISINVSDLETSNTSMISHLYNELKKQYTDFTEDI
jgi:phosphotransferase system IIA component